MTVLTRAGEILIGGQWRRGSGNAFATVNPTTEEEILSLGSADDADVRDAAAAAEAAAPGWADTSPLARTEALTEFARRMGEVRHELVDSIVSEVGKPVREATEEVARAISIVEYHAQATLEPVGEVLPSPGGDAFAFTTRVPLGTVGLITPWNFPVAIPLWKLAPALAYGNAVIVKPAPHATATALRLAGLARDLLPAGVLNVVTGGADVGRALARQRLGGLSFTGSTAAGTAVADEALRSGARFQAEMGGKNASVVLADADLDRAAATIAGASMGYAGQKCTATSRVIVTAAVADTFRRLLCERMEALKVGRPEEPDTDVGPLIDRDAVERVEGFVTRARDGGANVVVGGQRRGDLGPTFFAPTLIEGVSSEGELATTEVFGPVLTLFVVADADEALELANRSTYGLAAAVFTEGLNEGLRFAQRLRAGVIRVNGPTPGVIFNAPFAPQRASGIGLPEQGRAAQLFFTEERTVSVVQG